MSAPQRVMRSYTRGLKIPRLIGRLTEDFTLPGGPYTLTQFMVGVATIIIGYLTVGLWAGLLPQLSILDPQWVAMAALLPMGWGAAKVAGILPEDTNPIRAIGDLTSGTRPAKYGTTAGGAVDALPSCTRLRARVLTQGLHTQQITPDEHAAAPARPHRAAAAGAVVDTTPGPEQPTSSPAGARTGSDALVGALMAAMKEQR